MKPLQSIHLIAACGTGMGTLACVLKEMGYTVTGSDSNVYPPMSDFLQEKQIELFAGFDPANLDHNPDLVIVGNAVTRQNPEAVALLERGIDYMSMPQAVNRFIAGDKKIILVTGTHGKTTTSSIMAHLLHTAGLDPSFMIGGILRDYDSSFRIGRGDYMVIEGDEYDTAFFDKGPKFMHYTPEIAIMTGIEFDHADIFRDIDHIKSAFTAFVEKNREKAHFIAFDGNEHLAEVMSGFRISSESYGSSTATSEWSFSNHGQVADTTFFKVMGPETGFEVRTKLVGRHNLYNILACIAAATRLGISPETICRALTSFSGIKRRQEIRGIKNGITVMDDFAHHPTAVNETIRAVKPFYREGRIIAVFEPRTNTSMRSFFQKDYPQSFLEADIVCICEPGVKKKIPERERFSTRQLVSDIGRLGTTAYYFKNTREAVNGIAGMVKSKDLVLIMSNGGFDHIHTRLLEKIE